MIWLGERRGELADWLTQRWVQITAGPCIKVVCPLSNGNAIIVLRPRADVTGGLSLVSDGRRFGDPGFYFTVVAEPGAVWVRYVRTMKEELNLRMQDGAMAASQRFAVFGLPFLELRYDIARKAESRGVPAAVDGS